MIELWSFFQFFADSIVRIIDTLDNIWFSFAGIEFSLWQLNFSLFIIGFITFAFWKGAKT